MLIIPAIDIKNGKCVRLTQGDFSREKIYNENPIDVAKKFEEAGAEMIHVVDLDGAKDGVMKNKTVVKHIAKSVQIPVEVGGGIRDKKTIDELLSYVLRIILGTAAIENKAFLQQVLNDYGNKIAVSLDAKNGIVTTKGWIETTDVDVFEYIKELETMGVKTIIYTDIARDGTLSSPNFESIQKLRTMFKGFLIASGGVSSMEDITKLKELGVDGVIIGKALYENKLKLQDAILACHSELDSESSSSTKGRDAEINSA